MVVVNGADDLQQLGHLLREVVLVPKSLLPRQHDLAPRRAQHILHKTCHDDIEHRILGHGLVLAEGRGRSGCVRAPGEWAPARAALRCARVSAARRAAAASSPPAPVRGLGVGGGAGGEGLRRGRRLFPPPALFAAECAEGPVLGLRRRGLAGDRGCDGWPRSPSGLRSRRPFLRPSALLLCAWPRRAWRPPPLSCFCVRVRPPLPHLSAALSPPNKAGVCALPDSLRRPHADRAAPPRLRVLVPAALAGVSPAAALLAAVGGLTFTLPLSYFRPRRPRAAAASSLLRLALARRRGSSSSASLPAGLPGAFRRRSSSASAPPPRSPRRRGPSAATPPSVRRPSPRISAPWPPTPGTPW